ncbi:hypothetical protein ACFLV4_03735 [Chloroflexota bacterium]
MKKLTVLFVLLLLGVIVVTSGCDYETAPIDNLGSGSSASGSGWIYDEFTGNKVTFKYKLLIIDAEPVTLPEFPPIGEWPARTFLPVVGQIQIRDTSDHINVQVKSRLDRGDPATANLYYSGYWGDSNGNDRMLYARDCKVNVKGEYSFMFIHEIGYGVGGGYDDYDDVLFGYIDKVSLEPYGWKSATEEINLKRQEAVLIEAEPEP